MGAPTKRATVYFDTATHRVQQSLSEDAADLAAFEERVNEPLVSYETVLKGLKASGRLKNGRRLPR